MKFVTPFLFHQHFTLIKPVIFIFFSFSFLACMKKIIIKHYLQNLGTRYTEEQQVTIDCPRCGTRNYIFPYHPEDYRLCTGWDKSKGVCYKRCMVSFEVKNPDQ